MPGEAAARRRHLRRAMERFEKERPRNLLAEAGCHDFIIGLDHLKPEFNVGKIFRSADAFGAREIHLVGVGPFDPRPSMGSFRHVPARWFDSIEECLADLRAREYRIFALDPAGAESVYETELPAKSAFLLGHEEYGFSFDPAAEPDITTLSIPQYGHVQSLNVSIAASILMYEYTRRRYLGKTTPARSVASSE